MSTLPADFNWEIYRELNSDLKIAIPQNKQSYQYHYLKHGINENRQYLFSNVYPMVDLKYYRTNHADLRQLSDMQLMHHWINYGQKENRSFRKDINHVFNINQKKINLNLSNSSYYLYKTNINVKYPKQYINIYLMDELIYRHTLSNKNVFYTKQTNCNTINEYTIVIEANSQNNIDNIDFNIEWLSYHDTILYNYNVYFVNTLYINDIKPDMIKNGYFIIYNFDFSLNTINKFRELGLENTIYMIYNNVLNYENVSNIIDILKKRINNLDKIHIIDNETMVTYELEEIYAVLHNYYKNNELKDKTMCCLASYPKRSKILLNTLDTLYNNNFDSINIFMNSYDLDFCSMIMNKYKNTNILLDKLGSIRSVGKFFWCNYINNNLFICDDDIYYPLNYKKIGLLYIENEIDAIYSCLGVVFKDIITAFPIGKERILNIKFTEATYNKKKVHLVGTGVCFFRTIENRFPSFSYFLEYICYNDDLLAIWSKQNKKNMYAVKKVNQWLKANLDMEIGLYEEKLVDPVKQVILEKYIKENPWRQS